MTTWDALGPFQPDPGAMPPHLGGREQEKDLFRALLTRMENRAPLPAEIILYGPRGNGKTVLLRWLEDEAASRRGIETVVLLPSSIPDTGRLAERLLPKSWWDRLTPEQVAVAGLAWRPGTASGPPPPPEDVLSARARKAPLVVVMDEAHTLDLGVGRALLNASQFVRHRYPLLLVLAGTPNVEGHLGAMDASFWNRARTLRVGTLPEDATRDALRLPFEAAGVRVDEGVLADMVRLSHGYPYFIQLLGQKTWAAMASAPGPGEVTPETFKRARPAFEHDKSDYYRHCYRELREEGLRTVARSVAAAFQDHSTLDEDRLEEAIRAGLDDRADSEATRRAESTLTDLGFIWSATPTPGWEPGIPSLMDYVLEFAPAP